MREYVVDGTIYELPDDMSEAEVTQIMRRTGVIPGLPAEPIAEAVLPITPIASADELAAGREEARVARVATEMAARQQNMREDEIARQEQRLLDREERAQQQDITKVLQPGVDEPRRASPEAMSFFRPSRIVEQEIPAVLPSGEILTERRFVEPDGEVRPATASDEAAESFAQQPLLGAESVRVMADKIAADQAEIQRRQFLGEDVSWFEFAGPALSGILTEPDQTAGVVETELGTALRSTMGWVSALAAEGYFRGLGYEVDANGVPIDKEDLGYAIAQGRRALGIPDVVYPLQLPSSVGRAIVGAVDEEAATKLEEMLKAVPQLAVPTPGVASSSQSRKLTTFDPEGRRTVSVAEVPSPLEDFSAWKEAELARISQNVANGRTMGDEFLDAPAVRDFYAQIWGDPDAAYYAGSLAEMFYPAGPGTAAKGLKGATKLASKAGGAKAASAAARSAIKLAEAVEAGKPTTQLGRKAKAAALAVTSPVADVAAAIVPGRASDGRVVRRVADKVLKSSGFSKEAATAARAAIKRTSDTPAAIMRDVAPILGEDAALFGRTLVQNVPDDVVMVTANVGVPRVHEPALRRSLQAFRRETFGNSPKDVLHRLPDEIAGELGRFDDWSEVPAALRLEATTLLEDAHAIKQAPRTARLGRDLTSLQTYFDGQRSGLDRLLGSRGLDTPTMRRARAITGLTPLQSETAALARAGTNIKAVAQTELARVGKRLTSLARERGSADEAVDIIFRDELARADNPIGPEEAWLKAMGVMYGDERKALQLYTVALNKELIPRPAGVTPAMPTVDTLRAMDVRLMRDNVEGMVGARGTSRLTEWLAPEYQKVLLKVAVDEGTKKAVAAAGRYTEQLGSAIESLTTRAGEVPAGVSRALELMGQGVAEEIPRLRRGRHIRTRVYDKAGHVAEQAFAENGEQFAKFIEEISPRVRKPLHHILFESLGQIVGRGRRNVISNARYGYVLPNVVGFPTALFKQMLTPILTSGLKETGDIMERLLRRRTFGGGLTTNDGVYYSGKQLNDLGEQLGLGYTAVESGRVGSLAGDLLRDARRAAEGPVAGAVKRELDPFDKSFWTRTAEAVEVSFRQAAFEAQLLKGQTPDQAADFARRAFFRYDDVPEVVRAGIIGQTSGTAAANFRLYVELMQAIATNPSKARLVLKAKMQQARAQDPHNLHGDKALKSIGLIDVGNGTYFGPEVPLFASAEMALGMARQADLLASDLSTAMEAAKQTGASLDEVVYGGEVITRSLADEALPAVMDAAAQFAEGEAYATQGIDGADPISDEQMFWAAALYAHHSDQDRETGAYDWFETLFQPTDIPPPEGMANKTHPEFWAKAPKGTPHVLWGRDERGLPLYKVFEMSEQGAKVMKVLRAATPSAIEMGLVTGSAALELKPGAQPEMIYGGAELPDTVAEGVAGSLLGRAPESDREAIRRKQIAEIQAIQTAQ